MSQWVPFLSSLALWALLAALLLVLLPLQGPAEGPAQLAQAQPYLSCPRQGLDRICFQEGTLLNLGTGFVLEEAPELSLNPGKLEQLLSLLEQLPPGEAAPPPQGEALRSLRLQSIRGETRQLSLYEQGESLLLWDGDRCCRYSRRQLAPLLEPLAAYAQGQLLPDLSGTEGSLRFWSKLLPEALNLDYSLGEEALLRWEGSATPLPREPGEALLHSLSGLAAAEAVSLFPSQEELQKAGLDAPFCIIQLKYSKKSVLLCFSKPLADGTVYGLRQDLPLLFRLEAEALPFLELCRESLSREPLFALDYEALCKLQVQTQKNSWAFTKWQGQVLCRGKPLEEGAFGAFVRRAATPLAAGLPLWPEQRGPLLLSLTLGYANPSRPQDRLQFWAYPPAEGLALCQVGDRSFTVERAAVEALLSQLEALLS